MKLLRQKSAFTLIELITFVGIFALFFVSAISIVTFSVRNMKYNEFKIKATHAGTELLEWTKGEREEDWAAFISSRASSGGITWCFNEELIANWPSTSGSCSSGDYSLDNFFKREMRLTTNAGTTQVSVMITVSWLEGSLVQRVPINSVLSVSE